MLKIGDSFRVNINHPEYGRHKDKVYTVRAYPVNTTFAYKNELGELFLLDEVEPA